MLSAPLVRPARDADAADVVRLLESEDLEAAFDPAEFVVARDGARLLGCARLRPLPGGAHEIASVAVAPDARGRGVGEALVRTLQARASGPVLALALAPGFFAKQGFARLDATPEELRAKADGACASKGFVPMAWTPSAVSLRVRARYSEVARERPDAPLGTGDPVSEALLRPGEVVVDLGSGAGGDVLAAARAVGPHGRAVGVDFSPDMLSRARAEAARAGVPNAAFVEGRLEALPLPDAFADVVVSNCVVNLAVDKRAALAEALRVLKPGGRLVVSDVLRGAGEAEEPSCDCVAGAMSEGEWRRRLAEAGFVDAEVAPLPPSGCCDGSCRVAVRARRPAA